MKITQTALLLLTSCMLLSSTCKKDDPDTFCKHLKINNNTDKPVYTLYSYDYPDTSLNFQSPRINPNARRLGPQSKQNIDDTHDCVGSDLSNPVIQKLSVFVFDAQLVDTIPWDQVRQRYLVQKRFDLTLDDLINNNYTFNLQ